MTVLTGAGCRIIAVSKSTFSLGPAMERYSDVASAGGANKGTYQFVIEDPVNAAWEIGTYTWDKSNNTLTRHAVVSSSSSNNPITPAVGSFVYAGATNLYVTQPGINASATGYGVGSGGTVTQLTSKSTGVTLNKLTGKITMHNASLAAAATAFFTVTNSQVTADDVPNVAMASGGGTAGSYDIFVDGVAAGAFVIGIQNISAGALAEAVKINFAVFKGATS